MEHNTDLVMTCNNCESQEFSTLEYAGEHFYECFHCEAIDDYRMAPELAEAPAPVWGRHIDPLMPAIERFMTRPVVERKPAAAEREFVKAFTPNRHGEYA